MYIRYGNKIIPIETLSFGELPTPIDTPFGDSDPMLDAYHYSASGNPNPPTFEETMRPWDVPYRPDYDSYPYPPKPPYRPSRHIFYFAVFLNGKILNAYERRKDAEALFNDITLRMEAKNQLFTINFPLNYSEIFKPFNPHPHPHH